MKKVFFILLGLVSFCVTNAVAEQLYTLRSEHFEFIYPEESEETAILLFDNAENLYEKATSLLQTDINLFMPVFITPNTQQLNAYYTAAPYNRIVFFDTPPDYFDLAVFSETKVSVFYHELVHAVTMNMKNGFWNFISTVLGDVYSPSYLIASSLSFLEGATVSFESMDGEGRLNSGDNMAYLVQAKIEDVFPGWKDASGPRDIFPKAKYAYLFGGAFNSYIQKKYGMEKYAELWNYCGSGGGWNPFIDASFKTVYGVSIEDEWNAFAESIPVPVLADDVDVRAVAKKPSYHSAMAFRNGNEKGIAFLDNSSYIKYVPVDDATGLPGKEKTLLLADGYVSDLSFTDDGRYLLITGIGTNILNEYSLKIYDMEKDEYVVREIYPLSVSCLAEIPSYGKFIVGAAVRSGRAYLEIRDFNDILTRGAYADVLFSEKLPINREVYAMCAAGGKVWSLEKEAGVWNIAVYELGAKENSYFLARTETFSFPENIAPSSLSYGGEKDGFYTFYCAVAGKGFPVVSQETASSLESSNSQETSNSQVTYGTETAPGFLSRLLTVEIPAANTEATGARVFLAKGDVSGGVHRPFYDAATDTLYFIARKAESLDVSYCHGIPGGVTELSPMCAELAQKENAALVQSAEIAGDAPQTKIAPQTKTAQSTESEELLPPVERGTYKPSQYIFQGTFIPAGMDLTTDTPYLVGLSWLTMDPTERFRLLVSGGWDYVNEKGGVSFRTWGGSTVISYSATLLAEWNKKGFSKASGKLSLSGAIPIFTRRQEIQYSNDTLYTYTSDSQPIITNNADISYVSSFKIGKGVYDSLSFSGGVSYAKEYEVGGSSPISNLNNIGFHVSAGAGGIIPISVQASVARSSESFLSMSAKAVLFSAEIQKGVPFFPLYANRFTLTGGYMASWKTSPRNMMIRDFPNLITDLPSLNVKHGVTCSANFTMSPIMSLIYSFQFELGADFTWYFANEQDLKRYDLVLCGVFTF